MLRDLKNSIAPIQAITPALKAASVTGAGVDLKDYDSAAIIINPGIITDGVHTPKLQESVDNSTFTDVAAADQEGALAALATDTLQEVGYKGTKRYVRVFVTVTGSPSTGGVYGAMVIKGHAHARP